MITHSYDNTIKYQQHAENTQNCAEIFFNTFRKNTNSAEKKIKKNSSENTQNSSEKTKF